MSSVVLDITIGRNTDRQLQLGPQDWEDFKDSVRIVVEEITAHILDMVPANQKFVPVINHYMGQNMWNGVLEESYKLEAIFEYPVTMLDIENEVNHARSRITKMADWYNQDAIAVNIGQTDLFYAPIQ